MKFTFQDDSDCIEADSPFYMIQGIILICSIPFPFIVLNAHSISYIHPLIIISSQSIIIEKAHQASAKLLREYGKIGKREGVSGSTSITVTQLD